MPNHIQYKSVFFDREFYQTVSCSGRSHKYDFHSLASSLSRSQEKERNLVERKPPTEKCTGQRLPEAEEAVAFFIKRETAHARTSTHAHTRMHAHTKPPFCDTNVFSSSLFPTIPRAPARPSLPSCSALLSFSRGAEYEAGLVD